MVIASFDIETDGLDPTKLVFAHYRELGKKKGKDFYNSEDLYNHIMNESKKYEERGKRLYIYAHYGQYDFYGAFKGKWHEKNFKIVRENPIFVHIGERTKILDSRTFFNMPLKKLGEIVGLEKLEMPEELLIPKQIDLLGKKVFDYEKIRTYCKRDVDIVLKAIEQLRNTIEKHIGYKPRKMETGANLALKMFIRHLEKEGTKGYLFATTSKGLYAPMTKHYHEIKKAYRGGRVEDFQQGSFPKATSIDVNSLYPYVMMNMKFPDLLTEKKIEKPLEKMSEEEFYNKIGIVKATVKSPEKGLMVLPIKIGTMAIQYLPDRKLTGYWTIDELRTAKEAGYKIIQVDYCITYKELRVCQKCQDITKGRRKLKGRLTKEDFEEIKEIRKRHDCKQYKKPYNPFKKHMEHLYKMKQEVPIDEKVVIKLLMNGLYGKWAQANEIRESKWIKKDEAYPYLMKGWIVANEWEGDYLLEKTTGEIEIPKWAHIVISCLITSHARIKMYHDMKKIPYEQLLYCDTDSIKFIGEHLEKYSIGKEMGEYKLEEHNEPITIIKRKAYKHGDKIVLNSVNNREDITIEALKGEEPIVQTRTYTFTMAKRTGKWDKIGTTYKIHTNIKQTKREEILQEIPKEIEE